MTKMHTRLKRKMGLTTHTPHRNLGRGKFGARTFPTEESAKTYAKEHEIAVASIVPAKKGKRFKIVSE